MLISFMQGALFNWHIYTASDRRLMQTVNYI